MPLLKLRPRPKAKSLTALEMRILSILELARHLAPVDFRPDTEFLVGNICRADARRALSALWRRGLLTRVGWGDTAVYRRRP